MLLTLLILILGLIGSYFYLKAVLSNTFFLLKSKYSNIEDTVFKINNNNRFQASYYFNQNTAVVTWHRFDDDRPVFYISFNKNGSDIKNIFIDFKEVKFSDIWMLIKTVDNI